MGSASVMGFVLERTSVLRSFNGRVSLDKSKSFARGAIELHDDKTRAGNRMTERTEQNFRQNATECLGIEYRK